jgi:NADP-dependent 3-hydroxy acid dehydrogenase YdfG
MLEEPSSGVRVEQRRSGTASWLVQDRMASDRVLLITGASTGIGAATARAAAAEGYRVALGARSEERLEALAEDLGPERALAQRCDVTDWDDQQAFVAATLERFGRLDAVFANAGFGAKRGFLEETVEHWRAMIDTNVLGVALTIRAALPHLREQNAGHFLITGSVAGRRALPGSLYSATKWAVTAMGEALRQELAETDVKVTLIEPGMVDTPFFEDRPSGALEPDDIARAVLYALSQPRHVDVNEILVRPIHQPL